MSSKWFVKTWFSVLIIGANIVSFAAFWNGNENAVICAIAFWIVEIVVVSIYTLEAI